MTRRVIGPLSHIAAEDEAIGEVKLVLGKKSKLMSNKHSSFIDSFLPVNQTVRVSN
jgi:hypothetical protein